MAEVERLVVGPLATNCYLLKSGEELAIIDPGGDAERIVERARALGGTVKYVIDTHGHVDHVAANLAVRDAFAAELVIHDEDSFMLLEPDNMMAGLVGMRLEPVVADRTVVNGDEVAVGDCVLRVLHTPGHTPGGICLLGDGFAFTGDTLFIDSVGRTDFPGGSMAELRESVAMLRARLAGDTMLYPGHGEPGSFARASLVNPFLGSFCPA